MSPRKPRKSRNSVSVRIGDDLESIIEAWLNQVRREVPAAAKLSDAAVRNGMPEFLRRIGDVVSTTVHSRSGERSSIETLQAAREHGVHRAMQPAYTLDQVISEYRILRQILFASLEGSGDIGNRERDKILESVDYGVVEAAVQFTAVLGFNRALAADVESKGLRTQLAHSRQDVKSVTSERDRLQLEREMREQFVSVLTHDLINPLAAASMRTQLIHRVADRPDTVRALLPQLAADLHRADRMIHDLLDANRIRAGELLQLNIVPTDLAALAKGTIQTLTEIHGERFNLTAPSTLDAFLDQAGIERILENLCSNAIKYGDKKAPVDVALEATGSEVRISVHNEGPTLSWDDQKTLFQQFRRTESAKVGGKTGWGLGLTLVKGMAESHGGSVTVESEPGKGTTFTVFLPRDARKVQKSA